MSWQKKITRYTDVTPVKQDWLWLPRVPISQITLLAGNSDSAKSLFLADLIAMVTRGKAYPDGSGHAPKGSVLIFSEDCAATVTGPRLIAAGADRRKVTGWSEAFLLDNDTDLADLRSYLEAHSDTRLIIFDPLMDYLKNAHNYYAARATLLKLREMAHKCGAAVIGVGHPVKALVEPIHSFGGSRGVVTASRAFWYLARQEDDSRLLLWVKGNVGVSRVPGMKFMPVAKTIKLKDGTKIETAYTKWDDAPIEMIASDWFAIARAKLKTGAEPKGAKGAAILFLKDHLKDGQEHPASEVLAAAAKEGIKRGSLQTAREELKIVVRKLPTEDGAWMWSWPGASKEPKAEEPAPKRTRNTKGNNVIVFPVAKKPAS
jgi:putative DNA primase/helicase